MDYSSNVTTRMLDDLRRLVARVGETEQKRLPPERELARMLKTNRSVLRQALDVLEKEGLIWRHVGRGTFAGPKPPAIANRFHDLVSATSPNEIMEARLVIEPKLAAIAALRATLSEIREMERAVQKASATTDIPKYERWDGQFHRLIAESSRNSLLMTFFNVLNAIREESFWGRLKEKRLKPDRIANYNNQHRDILNALQQRDAARAEEMMTTHLQTVQRDLQE